MRSWVLHAVCLCVFVAVNVCVWDRAARTGGHKHLVRWCIHTQTCRDRERCVKKKKEEERKKRGKERDQVEEVASKSEPEGETG